MGSTPRLAILATTRATAFADGRISMSRKFLDGVFEYQRHWDGALSVFMQPSRGGDPDLDRITLEPRDLPFTLIVKPYVLSELAAGLTREPTTVLASLDGRWLPLQRSLRQTATRWVAFVEWSLATRKRITVLTTPSPITRSKRLLGAMWRERAMRAAARMADGLQCNGTPAFDDYGGCNGNTLLYFDGRLASHMLASASAIKARSDANAQTGRLRLVFTGRLTTIKGADQLVDVAFELNRTGTDFEMAICGDGELREPMRQRLEAMGLGHRVCFKGVLDFERELIPFMQQWPDVFVCCHRQGDPACTYLETLGCGVPIAGYANEALAGLHRACTAGWVTPMDRPDFLARRLAELATDRQSSLGASMRALEFGARHTFDKTFSARAEHLLACSLA